MFGIIKLRERIEKLERKLRIAETNAEKAMKASHIETYTLWTGEIEGYGPINKYTKTLNRTQSLILDHMNKEVVKVKEHYTLGEKEETE